MKLSILIPSVHTRRNSFLPTITERIYSLYEKLPKNLQKEVEILILIDNKKMMLGEKRNKLIDIAQGDYIQFVDDDDRIEDSFIIDLLEGIKSGADVITFQVSVSINGEKPKICYYSKDFKQDYNTPEAYYRIPNHICCVKREISRNVSFPNIKYGEDSGYSKLLLPYLKSEFRIEKVLYHYDFNVETTETQEHLNTKYKPKDKKPIVDVVFLSNAKNKRLEKMTQRAIDTCILKANGLVVNVIVVEQNENISYKNATTFHKADKFNYNAFANFGAKQGNAEWIMICNNDLEFKNGYLHNLISAGNDVVSPKCPRDPRQKHLKRNEIGDKTAVHFSGWCFMIKRTLWEKIKGFDEDFSFWFADDSVIEQVKKAGVMPMIVPSAQVVHLGSTTIKGETKEVRDDYTWGLVKKFNKKYGKNKFEDNPHYQAFLRK